MYFIFKNYLFLAKKTQNEADKLATEYDTNDSDKEKESDTEQEKLIESLLNLEENVQNISENSISLDLTEADEYSYYILFNI